MGIKGLVNWIVGAAMAIAIVPAALSLNSAPVEVKPSAIPVTTQPVSVPASSDTKRFRVAATLSGPEDLKVKEGDRVKAGQVLADRDAERSRLTFERQTLVASIQRIREALMPAPPLPVTPPVMLDLPKISYAEQVAAISSARLDLAQAKRVLALYQQSKPLSLYGSKRFIAIENIKSADTGLVLQRRKADAVGNIEGIPPEIVKHEGEVLARLEQERNRLEADLTLQRSQEAVEVSQRDSKLRDLQDAVQQSTSSLGVAYSKLQAARDDRSYNEYQHSVLVARRAQENNQAAQAYARQRQEYLTEKRDRDYQIADLNGRLSSVDEKLSQIAVVKAPYDGVVKRIKNLGQSNNAFNVELVLLVRDGARSIGVASGTSSITSDSRVSATQAGRGSTFTSSQPNTKARSDAVRDSSETTSSFTR